MWRGAECAGGLGPSKQRLAIDDVGNDGNSDDAGGGVGGADDGGSDGDGDGAAGGLPCCRRRRLR